MENITFKSYKRNINVQSSIEIEKTFSEIQIGEQFILFITVPPYAIGFNSGKEVHLKKINEFQMQIIELEKRIINILPTDYLYIKRK